MSKLTERSALAVQLLQAPGKPYAMASSRYRPSARTTSWSPMGLRLRPIGVAVRASRSA